MKSTIVAPGTGAISSPLSIPLTEAANTAALGLKEPSIFAVPVLSAELEAAPEIGNNEIHISRENDDPFSRWLIGEGDRQFGAPRPA